jgi:hypothetical protein
MVSIPVPGLAELERRTRNRLLVIVAFAVGIGSPQRFTLFIHSSC